MAENLTRLLDKYLTDSITDSELEQLHDIISSEKDREAVVAYIDNYLMQSEFIEKSSASLSYKEQSRLLLIQRLQSINPPAAHRIHFFKTAWFKYAAAILITVGIGAYFWNTNKKADQSLANGNTQTDVPPGGEKAVLTLADGTKIILDKAVNGQLANESGVKIVKLANGQIAYDVKDLTDKDIMWNTMSTPAGGQYQVILSDGTKVWLNATSSITYPTAFVDKKRSVKISGEVYFEVAKNKAKPFVVNIDGKSTVEVLGTRFNINSYGDDGNIKTTLVEGSVKVTRGTATAVAASSDRQQKPNQTSVVLRPGQQAQVSTTADALSSNRQPNHAAGILIVNNPDLDQILAWKNGLFSFNDADIRSVMRQLERWYDIKVRYEGAVSDLTFNGKMYRNVNLSDVLEVLQRIGLRFRMEGKTLVVL